MPQINPELFHTREPNQLQTQFQAYLNTVQEKCREKWSTFNIEYCLVGLCLIAFSIFNLTMFITGSQQQTGDHHHLETLSAGLFKVATVLTILFFLTSIFIKSNLLLPALVFCLNSFLLVNIKSSLRNIDVSHLVRGEHLICMLILLIPFSNSFIVLENISVRFLLISLLIYEFLTRLRCSKNVTVICFIVKLLELALVILLLRLTGIFFVCREEALLLNCAPTIFSTQITKISFHENSPHSILTYSVFIVCNFSFMSFVVFTLLRPYLKRPFWKINSLITLKMCTLLTYWILQLTINVSRLEYHRELNQIALYLARIFYSCFVFSQFLIWKNPGDSCQKWSPNEAYLRLVTYLLVSFSLLASLLSAESVMSIWILVLVMFVYARHRSSWDCGN